MMKRKRTWVLGLALSSGLGLGCGSEMNNPGNTAGSNAMVTAGTSPATAGTTPGTAGTTMGTAGTTGQAGMSAAGGGGSGAPSDEKCTNMGTPQLECPMMPPMTGACAANGPCCHRASNKAKEAALGPDDPLVLEYRVSTRSPRTTDRRIGVDALRERDHRALREGAAEHAVALHACRAWAAWRSAAWAGSRSASAATTATARIATTANDGRAVAQDVISTDAARWAPRKVMVKVDATKTGVERITPLFADQREPQLTYTPFLTTRRYAARLGADPPGLPHHADPTSAVKAATASARAKTGKWTAGGEFVIYTPIQGNDIADDPLDLADVLRARWRSASCPRA